MSEKKRETTPSFVCELPLQTTQADEHELLIRLEMARQIYNATLGESLRLLTLMRESRDWQRAKAMPKGKERSALFRAVIDRFDFKQSAIDRLAIKCKNECSIGAHLGPHEVQAVGKRAFGAVRQYAFGKRGRPRFKGHRGLHSVEGKSDSAAIRWRGGRIEWNGLSIAAIFDPRDRDGWQTKALSSKTKYCRVIRRMIRNLDSWYVQLIQEGQPPKKVQHKIGKEIVGLDIGPSTIAIVGETDAMLNKFCPTIEQPWRKTRRIQRAMDRSRRATNPGNYNEEGTVKKGAHTWVRSSNYLELKSQLKETERCLASERKRSHGELANRIISIGSVIKTEKISYRSFKKNYGRSVKVRAPGMFVSALDHKAESAGGRVEMLSTWETKLSQVCHRCGSLKKKPLSLRVHNCDCGIGPVQRDLYSAFLARFVSENKLDASQAKIAWPGAEPLLVRAASSLKEPTRGGGIAVSHAVIGVRVGCSLKGIEAIDESAHVVPALAGPGGPR
jgi:putative transposase